MAKPKNLDKYLDRVWLNPEGGRASIECKAEMSRYSHSANLEASVEISDCTRSVTLEFGAYTLEDAIRVQAKLRRLITRLTIFETAVKQFAAQVKEAP